MDVHQITVPFKTMQMNAFKHQHTWDMNTALQLLKMTQTLHAMCALDVALSSVVPVQIMEQMHIGYARASVPSHIHIPVYITIRVVSLA